MTEREIYEWVLDQIANYESRTYGDTYEADNIIKGLKLVKGLIEDYGDLEDEPENDD